MVMLFSPSGLRDAELQDRARVEAIQNRFIQALNRYWITVPYAKLNCFFERGTVSVNRS